MPRPHVALPTQISLLRICAQGLVPATAARSVAEVTDRLLAVQGQQVSALPHALLARCPGARGSDVARAFNQGLLVRHRPMRGTVHITHARDFHWMRLALKEKIPTWEARERQRLGIDDAVCAQAAEVSWEAIAAAGGRRERAALFAAWIDALAPTHLTDSRSQRRWCQCLMWSLARQGAVIEGPLGTNQHYFIDARTLPAADAPQSGFPLTPATRERGLTEIARRYILGHGPVSVADLSWWTGLGIRHSAELLEAACAADSTLGRYQLSAAGGEDGALVPADPARTAQQRRGLLYMSTQLPSILADNYADATRLLFLPSFDEIYVGYTNRTCLTDAAGDQLICPARNGMFRPLIINNGRLIGVRPVKEGVQWLRRPPARTQAAAHTLIDAPLARLGS
ncbi:DNA glycosylase AlkZ-like family protein [Corynebacterium sp. Marseille-Q2516]